MTRTIKVYRHGLTMGTVPPPSDHVRTERREVQGWSEGAARRNVAFLRSVDERRLPAAGLFSGALTLTVAEAPPTPEEWARLRGAFLKRLERLGLVRIHWVTEWQRRGVPHLHCALWLPEERVGEVLPAWLAITPLLGSTMLGQHQAPIDDAVGWFKYVAKHAARGVRHVQRASVSMPPAWRRRSGRIWGYRGDWPLIPFAQADATSAEFYRLRRWVRGWRVADARRRVDVQPQAVRQARKMLQGPREASAVRGVSEWLPDAAFYRLLTHATA